MRTLSRRVTALLLTVLTVLLATGCVAIPESSAPQPIKEFNRALPTDLVPTPRRSDDPETLVRNFLKASADPDSGHRAARRFLTAGASGRWDDTGPMTVLDDVRVVVDERSESAVRLRIIGATTGELSPEGRLTPAHGRTTVPLNLTRVNGAWRINGDLPTGAITDLAQFEAAYRSANLYYPDRTVTHLVSDPRWFYGASISPTDLIVRLLAGPSDNLTGAVSSSGDIQMHGPVDVDGSDVRISLGGLTESDTRYRTMIAAQLIWTLAGAGIRGTYQITADGGPLVPERQAGWETADVKSFDPDPDQGTPPLHLVRDGGLYRVGPSGPVAVQGVLGAAHDLRAAAISADQQWVTAVAQRGDRQVLVRGRYGEDVAEVLSGAVIATPSFGAGAQTGFAVVDGEPSLWTADADTGEVRSSELDVSEVTAAAPGPITAMKVSPDGVRVVLLVGGKVMLAVISTNDRGLPALTGVYPAAYGIDTPVVSLTWGGPESVYVARQGEETPVMRIPLSGLPVVPMVSGNLKPPVLSIAAGRSSVFVGDSRTVLVLRTSSGSQDQYWTGVDDVAAGTVPVVPGS